MNLGNGETSLSEWSEEEEGGASEPLLDHDQDSTGYTTDDPALEHASMMNDTGLTDAEGKSSCSLYWVNGGAQEPLLNYGQDGTAFPFTNPVLNYVTMLNFMGFKLQSLNVGLSKGRVINS